MSLGAMQPKKPSPFWVDEDRPFLQRNDSMSLDIIRPKDVPRGKVMYVKDEDRSLKTEDIYKARPHYEHLQYLDKPDLAVGCTDPEHAGARARSYYMPMDRRPRDLSLTTADIELAQPKNMRRKGNRHTDPVAPNYELPSSFVRPQTPPRFNGRHLHDITDIEKAHPRVLHPERNYHRDPNDASDIEYASANYHERSKRMRSTQMGPRHDRSLDVSDIIGTKKTQPRCTNPLEPVYHVSTAKGATSLHAKYDEEGLLGTHIPNAGPEVHSEVAGSKPRKLTWDNGEPQFSLLREDIAGTVPQRWVGCVPHNIYDPPEVRPMISFHDPHDIPGAQVGTLRKGIEGITRRCTNPLNPRYTSLDGETKPHPVPVFEAERGGVSRPTHPLLQARATASSLPQLHQQMQRDAASPAGSQRPQYMQRDASAADLRGQQGTPLHGSRRPSRAGSEYGAPNQSHMGQGPAGSRVPPLGGGGGNSTLRFASGPPSEQGEMSRRSQASSAYGGHDAYGQQPGYGYGQQ